MKDYDKNEGSSYIHYWDGYSLHGWAMLLKLPVNHFQWIEDTSRFNENFIKIYCEENDKGYFFEVDVHYTKILRELHDDLPCLLENIKAEKVEMLAANFMIKLDIACT